MLLKYAVLSAGLTLLRLRWKYGGDSPLKLSLWKCAAGTQLNHKRHFSSETGAGQLRKGYRLVENCSSTVSFQ
jgi:hypothetical protein